MTDNQLIAIFRRIIINGLKETGYPYISVMQNFQPTQQGITSNPLVSFQKIHSHNYGPPSREYYIDEETEESKVKQTQQLQSRWQVSSLVTQLPDNENLPTSSDIAQAVCWTLQNDFAIEQLSAYNIGILRITDIINPYIIQDRDQYEANSSFDMMFVYFDEKIYSVNKITPPAEFNMIEV